MYVDADFALAVLKPSDWLKSHALRAAREFEGQLETSESTVLQLLVVLRRWDLPLDYASILAELHQVAPLTDPTVAALAARNIMVHGMTPFDAMLAARAARDLQQVLSSDRSFDRAGVRRVPLR